MKTRIEWNRAAVARLRMVHVPTGTAGNLVAHWGSRARLFLRYERIGAATLPVFEQFPNRSAHRLRTPGELPFVSLSFHRVTQRLLQLIPDTEECQWREHAVAAHRHTFERELLPHVDLNALKRLFSE